MGIICVYTHLLRCNLYIDSRVLPILICYGSYSITVIDFLDNFCVLLCIRSFVGCWRVIALFFAFIVLKFSCLITFSYLCSSV